MSGLNKKRILIFQQRGWAKSIGHFIAKKLQAEGCELAAITFKKTTHEFIAGQTEVKYSQIVNIDDIYEYPEKYIGNENITFEQICRELDIDSLWPLIHSERMLVRSYGEKYFYSYRQNVPDDFMVSLIKAHYKAIRDLIDNFKPDVILMASFVYFGHVLIAKIGERKGIPTVSIADGKVPGYFIFVHDHLVNEAPLIERARLLNDHQIQTANREQAQKFIREFREKFKQQTQMRDTSGKVSFLKKIRRELSPYKQIYNWYTKPNINSIKTVDPTIDYRPPRIILRDHYCQKKYLKFAQRFPYYPFEKIEKFIFYPLQFTPEASADIICPLFNNQVEIARQIAMSLPDDYTLVVKEHPGMVGLRTPGYLEKIARTPNVKLIDYRIPSEEVLKKADLLITNYSTSIFEAALYRKPVIMLSDSGIFKLLPNVIKHTDMGTMTTVIKKALALDTDNAEYERRLENYVAAVYDVGFNFNYTKAWEGGGEDLEILWQLYKGEIKRVLNFK